MLHTIFRFGCIGGSGYSQMTRKQSNDCRAKKALFDDETKTRRTVYLGRVSDKEADTLRRRIEGRLSLRIRGSPMPQNNAAWLRN
jgi:hypothetical protein